MSTSFSANQYENPFTSKKLGNWEVPNTYPERPQPMSGFTQIIANDRGHLKGGVPRSGNNPWGNFVGTWDLPKNIPGNCAKVSTARTTYAQQRLQMSSEDANKVLSGNRKNANRAVMREGTFHTSKRLPPMTTDRPASRSYSAHKTQSPRPLGTPTGLRTYTQRTPTPQQPASPFFDIYRCDNIKRSPIPTVPDIPEVLAQEALPREATPQLNRPRSGVSAF